MAWISHPRHLMESSSLSSSSHSHPAMPGCLIYSATPPRIIATTKSGMSTGSAGTINNNLQSVRGGPTPPSCAHFCHSGGILSHPSLCFFLGRGKGNPIKERCWASTRTPSGAFKGLFVRKIKSHCLKEGMFDGAGIIGLITVQGAYLEEETGRGARGGVDKSSDGITHDHENVTYIYLVSAFLSPCIIIIKIFS